MSSRYWCFTLNNPTVQDAEDIQGLYNCSWLQFLHATLETGQQGTPHYQGYLELTRHKPLQTVKNIFPAKPHLEPRRGTAKQALTYCLKELNPDQITSIPKAISDDYIPSILPLLELPNTITINTASRSLEEILSSSKSKKQKRDDRLLLLKEAIDMGKSNLELANLDFPLWLQHCKNLDHYRTLISKPRDQPVNVVVVYGPTGTGKSKYIKDTYPGAYWKQRSNWWDNYQDHETVLVDEFYGWLPYDLLLRICDRYPLLVETKGGQVNFTATTIVFTTNTIPERWYKNVYFKAFVRRVTKWIIMPTWGDKIETDDYIVAYKHMTDNEC